MRGEVGAAPTYAQGLPRIYCLDNLQNIRVMRVDGPIVSSAAISPHTTRAGDVRLRVGRITGVTTDSAYRRRGYATRVMHACSERMAELGCELSLLGSGVPSWYRKLGWERGGVERIYRFDRGNRHLLTSGSSLQMRRWREDADFARHWRPFMRRGRWAVFGRPSCCARCGRQVQARRSGWRCATGRWAPTCACAEASVTEYAGPADLVLPMLARDCWKAGTTRRLGPRLARSRNGR